MVTILRKWCELIALIDLRISAELYNKLLHIREKAVISAVAVVAIETIDHWIATITMAINFHYFFVDGQSLCQKRNAWKWTRFMAARSTLICELLLPSYHSSYPSLSCYIIWCNPHNDYQLSVCPETEGCIVGWWRCVPCDQGNSASETKPVFIFTPTINRNLNTDGRDILGQVTQTSHRLICDLCLAAFNSNALKLNLERTVSTSANARKHIIEHILSSTAVGSSTIKYFRDAPLTMYAYRFMVSNEGKIYWYLRLWSLNLKACQIPAHVASVLTRMAVAAE